MVDEYKDLDVYNLVKLSRPVNNIPLADRVATNAGYAHMYHLKHFSEVPEEMLMNCVIEHGFYTMRGAYIYEIMQDTPTILTFSDFRKEIIESLYDIKAIPIGPYIRYVDGVISDDETEELHRRNGRTLLVMPAHCSREESKIYDFDELFGTIDSLKKEFEKIIVSLPIFDLQRGVHKVFAEKGYDVVAVGAGTDRKYLRRLRTLIELSDAVFANAFTTGLVYAVYLNKPVYLLNQEIKIKNEVKTLYRTEETEIVDKFIEVSSDSTFGNISAQTVWGIKFAGFNCIKNKAELKKILLENSRRDNAGRPELYGK